MIETVAAQTPKARALAGLGDAEKAELLAAAGAMGLSSDDPFWEYAATATGLKVLLKDAKTASIQATEASQRVLKKLAEAPGEAQSYIHSAIDITRENLISAATPAIAKAVATEIRRQVEAKATGDRAVSTVAGMTIATLGCFLIFGFGVVVGRGGWSLGDIWPAINGLSAGQLFIGQTILTVMLGGLWWGGRR
ncbi:MAG: hypothetical protein B7Z71_00535 [Acidocella sp. 21-58-7]|nr:MAG: hypothetical protein B7Z71_00535 [Acidocella sp. 21-58-7]